MVVCGCVGILSSYEPGITLVLTKAGIEPESNFSLDSRLFVSLRYHGSFCSTSSLMRKM